MPVSLDQSVGEIVSRDFRAAAVFHRHRIDFCCGGRRTLEDACRERRVDPLDVLVEIDQACQGRNPSGREIGQLQPDALTAFIVSHHHVYVRRALEALGARTRKVAATHGDAHPEMVEVAQLFEQIAGEMTSHMAKEEGVLFPYIDALAEAVRRGEAAPPAPFGSIENPVRMMEHEHDEAGAIMRRIRELTRDYVVPDGACTTYTVCLRELEEFERDLHEHVHLENNVLFPKARALARA